MMQNLNISYRYFSSYEQLEAPYADLISEAHQAISLSYAPYSKFNVGCAVLLVNGVLLKGANQENASYSLTICAERTVLGMASSLHADVPIQAMAIAYNSQGEINPAAILSPCGACRQHILEYRNRQSSDFPILMTALDGSGILIHSISDILPFAFTGQEFLPTT